MFKVEYKTSLNGHWVSDGNYSNEAAAINAAMQRHKNGGILVRVLDGNGHIVYSK